MRAARSDRSPAAPADDGPGRARSTPGRWELREDARERPAAASASAATSSAPCSGRSARKQREFAIAERRTLRPVIGRIAAKGLAGEAHDKPYVVVDGLDGRAHYVTLPKATDLADLPVGGIVEVTCRRESIADRNIAAIAENGWYLAQAPTSTSCVRQGCDPTAPKKSSKATSGASRRCAARVSWSASLTASGRVPADLVERGRAYDHGRLGGIELKLHSHLPIEKQVRAIGATWLDRQLARWRRVDADDGVRRRDTPSGERPRRLFGRAGPSREARRPGARRVAEPAEHAARSRDR